MNPTCETSHPNLRCVMEPGHAGPHQTRLGLSWTEPADYAEGGVTAAQIEKEAAHLTADETRSLVQERDAALTDATYWENTSKALTGAVERWQARAEKAEENVRAREEMINRLATAPRHVSNAMVKRAQDRCCDFVGVAFDHEVVEQMLIAALDEPTDPPTRPEGAEDIQRLVEEYTGPGGADFADYLAERLTDPTARADS